MTTSVIKDARWYAWYDACRSWDPVWHLEAMVHGYAFWLEGKSPWGLGADQGDDATTSDSYSTRIAAWNVPWSKTLLSLNRHVAVSGALFKPRLATSSSSLCFGHKQVPKEA